MANSTPFCVFCLKKNDTLRAFVSDTLKKCKSVLTIRVERELYEILRKSAKYIRTFIGICDWSNENVDEQFKVLEEFVCRMYGYYNLDDINLVRVEQFTKTYRIKRNEDIVRVDNNFDGSALPPCRSELRQHLLRTTYIAPIHYGWREEDDKYCFQWFEGDQLPSIETITDGIDREENIIENLNETESQGNDDDLEYGESALDDSSSDTSLETSDSENDYEEA
ncbi:hypothetical protein MML48_2g00006242 [Holotrichia oblita]|uniref:Uncharacterized protein n=1 Tax=Holotrichia oblita TaxID=644536 RepID=A0ACB9TQX1_HOLOL|nr:hypothetical protein MML48_2g00006242 [Holotrichia oblita]